VTYLLVIQRFSAKSHCVDSYILFIRRLFNEALKMHAEEHRRIREALCQENGEPVQLIVMK